MKVEIQHLGHDKQWAWFRLPAVAPEEGEPVRAHRVLTLPREVLRYGFAQAELVLADVDYGTLRHDGTHWIAEMELLDVITKRTDPDPADVETPAGAGAPGGLGT